MESVRGIALDAAALFQDDGSGSVQLQPDSPRFLYRLRYSNLRLAVLSQDVGHESFCKKEALLEELGVLEAVRIISLSQDLSVREALKTLALFWDVPSASSVYVTRQQNDYLEEDLVNSGWRVLHFPSGIKEMGRLFGYAATINQLQEIPAVLAKLNKRALGAGLVVVGHTMKWSREQIFLKRGALPIVPDQYGLSFMPIELDQPLEQQLNTVDVVLHKATDEIQSIHSEIFGSLGSVEFSKGMRELQRYLKEHGHICVVDPFDRVLPILDRVATQAILRSLKLPTLQIIRSPRCVEVTTFEEPWLSEALKSGNVVLPAIVKPRVACGTSEAHTMAVVFRQEGFKGLPVPLPATIQEYIDHGAFQYKMYVVGSKLLYSRRRSTPDGAVLAGFHNKASSIVFDSLKSLPLIAGNETDEDNATNSSGESNDLNLQAVQEVADWLRNKLGLTIIGFDLVVQAGTQDYVIVDVNYFPSFKDVPDREAVPAFWDALLTAHGQWSSQLSSQ